MKTWFLDERERRRQTREVKNRMKSEIYGEIDIKTEIEDGDYPDFSDFPVLDQVQVSIFLITLTLRFFNPKAKYISEP